MYFLLLCVYCACLILSVSSSSWCRGWGGVMGRGWGGVGWGGVGRGLRLMVVALPGLFSCLFYSTRRFVLSLVLICSCVFSPCSIAITSLGEGRANLIAFRTFVRFALVWFCYFLFLLVSGKGCGLWLLHSLASSLTFLQPWIIL